MLALLFLWVLLLAFEVQPVKAATFTVPDYYPTIQAAVNAANSGDVIFVRNGTYNEHLIINKTLMLAGENRAGVAIDGNETGRVISVFADNCTITGFTVRGGGFTPWGSDSGIYMASSNNLVTKDNLINNKDWAVWLENSSSNNTVSNNLIANNWRGIYLNHSAANTIAGNNITDANQGICFESSSFNVVWNNYMSEGATGIAVYDSSLNNSVTCNTFSDNSMGVDVGGQSAVDCPSNNTFYHNNFIGNYEDIRFLTFFGTNSWENGYPSGGNYWTDYNGTDLKSGPYQNETGSDGIGDKPYIIAGNATDNYPLMHSFVPLSGDLNQDDKVDMYDAILASKAFGSTPSDKNWNSAADLNGDGHVDIFDVIILAQNFGKIYHP